MDQSVNGVPLSHFLMQRFSRASLDDIPAEEFSHALAQDECRTAFARAVAQQPILDDEAVIEYLLDIEDVFRYSGCAEQADDVRKLFQEIVRQAPAMRHVIAYHALKKAGAFTDANPLAGEKYPVDLSWLSPPEG